MRCISSAVLLAAALAAAGCAEQGTLPAPAAAGAGETAERAPSPTGFYVVVVADDADPAGVAADLGVRPRHLYASALRGFAARLSENQLERAVAHPGVALVEADQWVRPAGVMANAPWHLDRIDQRALPLDTRFGYPDATGVAYAYVIDSGIQPEHPGFGGRAAVAHDVFGGDGRDCNGHGNHVAGTIGSTTYGVAGTVGGTYSGVRIRGVKVLDCSGRGTVADFIAAVDWVRANAQRPAVASLAVSTGYSTALNAAVNALANAGIFVAVSAGDGNASACTVSPASAADAFTVAATDREDARWTGSNYGECVDAYAPGVAVTSLGLNGGTATMTGTSQAAGAVAGAAALYLATYYQIDSWIMPIDPWIKNNATRGVVTGNPRGTPNLLLYVGIDSWI